MQVVAQMQQQQNTQMNMMMNLINQVQGQGVGEATAAAQDAGDTPDPGNIDFQGIRLCTSCGKRAYLREGICFNMDCVSWKHLCHIKSGGTLLLRRVSPSGVQVLFRFL